MFPNTVEGLVIAINRAACLKHTSPHEAHHVLFQFGRSSVSEGIGYPGGDFTERLIAAIARADSHNRELLGRGFPGYVAACNVMENDSDGITLLREIIIADRMAEGLS